MQVLGFEHKSFKGNDGNDVSGYNVFLGTEIRGGRGDGLRTERYFLSDARCASCGYTPAIGDEIDLMFNRFGKVAEVVKVA